MDCSEHTPARIVPHCGKVGEDEFKPSRFEGRTVFNKCKLRTYFGDNSGKVFPESAAGSGDADASSGNADVLARKASRHHVNTACPLGAVECSNVVPNREWKEAPVILSIQQPGSGKVCNLDGAHGPPSQQLASKNASSSACD